MTPYEKAIGNAYVIAREAWYALERRKRYLGIEARRHIDDVLNVLEYELRDARMPGYRDGITDACKIVQDRLALLEHGRSYSGAEIRRHLEVILANLRGKSHTPLEGVGAYEGEEDTQPS